MQMLFRKYSAAIVCGFGASVLSIVPGLKDLTCCLLVPASAILAVFLDQRLLKNFEKIKSSSGIIIGLLTGLAAAFFVTSLDLLMTFVSHNNEFVKSLPQTELILREWNLGPGTDEALSLLKQMAKDIRQTGFSVIYLIVVLISNLFTLSVFGLLGGALGTALFNKRIDRRNGI